MLHATKKTIDAAVLLLLVVFFVEDNDVCKLLAKETKQQVFILIIWDDSTNPSLVASGMVIALYPLSFIPPFFLLIITMQKIIIVERECVLSWLVSHGRI